MNLVQTAAATAYPVSLAEARAQLGIDTQDYDARLAGLIAAATEAVETHIGRSLITRSYSGYLNWFPSDERGVIRRWISLEKPPLISVSAVTTYDDSDVGTVFAASNYYVDTLKTPGRVILRRGVVWPIPLRVANGIQVDFVAGYGAAPGNVPEAIRLAIQIMVGAFNEQRGDEQSAPAMPPAVIALLAPYLFWPAS